MNNQDLTAKDNKYGQQKEIIDLPEKVLLVFAGYDLDPSPSNTWNFSYWNWNIMINVVR